MKRIVTTLSLLLWWAVTATAQTIYFGAAYSIRVQHAGTQKIILPEGPVEADKLVATVKGKASEITFEIYISKDRTRTPVLIKAPLAMGVFSMELVR